LSACNISRISSPDMSPTAAHVVRVTALAGLVTAMAAASPVPITVAFDASTPLYEVADKYVSFNIDTGSLYNGMDFQDKLLRCVRSVPAGAAAGGALGCKVCRVVLACGHV